MQFKMKEEGEKNGKYQNKRDEYIENFLVINPQKLDYEVAGDEEEFINLYHVTKEEALKFVEEGRICDFKTIYAIQYLILHHQW